MGKTKKGSAVRPGDIFIIPLSDGTFAYGRLTPQDSLADFASHRTEEVLSFEQIVCQSWRRFPLLITLRPLESGKWVVIGNLPYVDVFEGQRFLVGNMIGTGSKVTPEGFIDPSSALRPATPDELVTVPKMRLANEAYLVDFLEKKLPISEVAN
jgi:hypothetical protein